MDDLVNRWKRLPKKTKDQIKASGLIAVFVSLVVLVRRRQQSLANAPVVVAFSEFLSRLKSGEFQQVNFLANGTVFAPGANFMAIPVPGSSAALFHSVLEHSARFAFSPESPSIVKPILTVLFPIFLGLGWFQMLKSLINPEENFVPSSRGSKIPKVKFCDVISPSKLELTEIVDFLNSPDSYREVGAKLPRGVLLVGPSGTGKTLMARAVAGEANCAFLSASASEFVETFVGKGSARIRSLFKQARELAPCVLFIDEIDALGKRDTGGALFSGNSAHEEYVHTLNQLLTELDGIGGHDDGIVVIAASNRFHAIDTALLRPGRFDRHVWLKLPTLLDRQEILRVHAKDVSLDDEVDLYAIAKECGNFNGADLANVINEAVFFSLRRNPSGGGVVKQEDLALALAKSKSLVSNRLTADVDRNPN